MVTEERFIIFPLEDIYKAVLIRCEREDAPKLAKGSFTSLSVVNKGEAGKEKIEVTLKHETDASEETLTYDRDFFALALVYYCQAAGIPLPRAGQKLLNVAENEIIMKITMTTSL